MSFFKSITTLVLTTALIVFAFSSNAQDVYKDENAIIHKRSGNEIPIIINSINYELEIVKFWYQDTTVLGVYQIAMSSILYIQFDSGKKLSFESHSSSNLNLNDDRSVNLISAGFRFPNYIISYERIFAKGQLGIGGSVVSNFFITNRDFDLRDYYNNARLSDYGINAFVNYYMYANHHQAKKYNSFVRLNIGYENVSIFSNQSNNYNFNIIEYASCDLYRTTIAYGVIIKFDNSFFISTNAAIGLMKVNNNSSYDLYYPSSYVFLYPFELSFGYRF